MAGLIESYKISGGEMDISNIFTRVFYRNLSFVLFLTLLIITTGQGDVAGEPSFKPLPLPLGEIVTYTSEQFLVPPDSLAGGDFTLAETPPTVDFAFYPEQTYPGNPWSETAYAPGLDINLHSRLGCPVEGFYAMVIDQRIHLERQISLALLFMNLNFPVNSVNDPFLHLTRGN